MNRITSNASFAIAKCRRFTQFLISPLKAQDSIQQITDKRNAALTCGFANGFDRPGTLRREPIRGSERAASRIARSVALAIGISLSIGAAPADGGSINAIKPKDYIRSALPKKEAICLSRLIGKESAWNVKAVGNLNSPSKSYTYGLLQLKNPIVKDMTAIEQIHYGIKYINHRYDGDACNAWTHWLRKGWH